MAFARTGLIKPADREVEADVRLFLAKILMRNVGKQRCTIYETSSRAKHYI